MAGEAGLLQGTVNCLCKALARWNRGICHAQTAHGQRALGQAAGPSNPHAHKEDSDDTSPLSGL